MGKGKGEGEGARVTALGWAQENFQDHWLSLLLL